MLWPRGYFFFGAMQYAEAVRYLYSLGNEVLTAKLGLQNISTLLSFLGQPHRKFRSILVAGTNGKGSVAAFIESILRTVGLNSGLYTSPHLLRIEERIRVSGTLISADEFGRLTGQVKEAVAALHSGQTPAPQPGRLERYPTYFEMVTAIALQHFAERAVDVAVLEVGLGGRLDATNVVDPLVAVITNVDYDHQAFLGNRLEEIAAEKAGIIKPRSREHQPLPVVCASINPLVRSIVEARCWETGSRCSHALDNLSFHAEPDSLGRFRLKTSLLSGEQLDVRIPLPGEHQLWNALTAIRAAELLRSEGVAIELAAIKAGLEAARWPGRLEVIDGKPPLILDGAHNPAGAECLRRYCEQFLAGMRIVLIFGAMRDKAIVEIAGKLFPLAQTIVLTAAGSNRSADPEEIAGQLPVFRANCHVASSPEEALNTARRMAGPGSVILVAGSLFLVGDIQRVLNPAAAA